MGGDDSSIMQVGVPGEELGKYQRSTEFMEPWRFHFQEKLRRHLLWMINFTIEA